MLRNVSVSLLGVLLAVTVGSFAAVPSAPAALIITATAAGGGASSGGGADTTPNSFTFTDQSNVALSSTITSSAITVAGIDAAASISVTGGTYDINSSGSFTSSGGTVSNGNTVRARHTSSGSNSTATNTVVTIGGVSDTFTSTTLAASGNRLVGDEFISMDMDSSGDGPNYGLVDGWGGTSGTDAYVDVTWVSTGGPGNRPYLLYEIDSPVDQFARAWYQTLDRNDASWGDTIFIRFSIWLANESQEQKLFQLCPSYNNCDIRPILTIEDESSSFGLRLQKDGGDEFIQWPAGPGETNSTMYGEWLNLQIELRYNTAAGNNNGYYALWVNNDTYGSPNISRSSTRIEADDGMNNSYISLAGYAQGALPGTRTYRLADFRIGPTFDASWDSSGSAVVEPTHFLDTFDAELDAANDERWELAA